MRKQKLWSLIGVAVLLVTLAVPSCLAYIRSMRALYANAAPCKRMSGMQGLLQQVGFVPTGSCPPPTSTNQCPQTAAGCVITNPPSGGSKLGHCVYSAALKTCVCVAKPQP